MRTGVRGPGLVSLALAVLTTPELAQSRPESAASRPARKLSVRQVPLPIKGDASVPAACSFSPDGTFLAVARGYDHSELLILDFAKRTVVYEDRSAKSAANFPPAFDSKSSKLMYTIEKGVAMVDLVDGAWKAGRAFKLPVEPWIVFPHPRSLAWSADGRFLALAETGEAHELDLGSGEARRLDCGKGQALTAIAVDQGFAVSCLAEGGYETAIFARGAVVDRVPDIRILARSGDGASWLIGKLDRTAGADSRNDVAPVLEVWDAKPRRSRGALSRDPDPKRFPGPCHAAFSFDGSVLVVGGFLTVEVRDGHTLEVLHTIRHYETNRLVAAALSPDGRHLVTMGRPTEREEPGVPVAGVVLWELSFE